MTAMEHMRCRTVVIGSGCAGLNAVDWLYQLGETDAVLITEDMNAGTSRNTGSDKQTYYKLSLSGDEGDSVGEMAKTLLGPDVNGDTALCEAAGSAPCFLRLAGLGVPFPTNAYGEYVGYRTDHDTRLRASSAGPLTSRYMTEALERSVRARNVRILDHMLLCRIERDGRGVRGVTCLDTENRRWVFIACAHAVLCTGGPAHIYRDRVYPESQHGMSGPALEAGAEGSNLHCWQYGLSSVGFKWNVSGSYQQAIPRYVSVDGQGCEREFLLEHLSAGDMMNLVFLKGYQWPFDERKKEASSRIDLLVKQETDQGRRVYLDYRRDPAFFDPALLSAEARQYLTNCGALCETPLRRLRAINAPAIDLYRGHGIALDRDMLEISVCAQHHNGGLSVDADWQTTLPGLYACGEAAGTFGQYRPGGAALNSAQVGGMRAALHIAHASRRQIPDAGGFSLPLAAAGDVSAQTAYFQAEMSRCAGIVRDERGMRRLMEKGREALAASCPADLRDPLLRERLLLRDLLLTQQSVLSAMLYARTHEMSGVLATQGADSGYRPPRPLPERDLWFERVWKAYRQQEARNE